ncbi:MAG: PfkB family carbohydrate kinase [Chloroflexota bacterium]|nr:PfkB family carbohydrate kinase [Dehalococcoidia bacterium]MDW8047624.1 PfkB family carbohydrate kinase [Chloroflexota bacterium]
MPEAGLVVVVGNVVLDRTADGWSPGGPALYAATAARRLGARVRLVTVLAPDYPRWALEGLEVVALPGERTPRYANTYDAEGRRQQRLLDPGAPLVPPREALAGAAVAILAPAYRELGAPPEGLGEGVVAGVSLQGLLRDTAADGTVISRADPDAAVAPFVREGWFLFLSEEDTPEALIFARRLARRGAVVFVTHGWRGAARVDALATRTFPAIPARRVVDPTGAGDCFAAAFLVTYARTRDEGTAIRAALAAGSLAVEGVGLAGVPDAAALERRLQEAA